MRARSCALIGLVTLIVLSGGVAEPDATTVQITTAGAGSRLISQEREAQILKAVVISDIGLALADPALPLNAAYSEMGNSISAMLFLFDSLNGEKSLKIPASLDGYYLGEHSGEIYECLLRRKGKSIKADLEEVLHSKTSECIERFGTHPSSRVVKKGRNRGLLWI